MRYLVKSILLAVLLNGVFFNVANAYDIRVLVTYSNSAKNLYPGKSSLFAQIDHLFAVANQGFANSGVNIHLIPVGFQQNDFQGGQFVSTNILNNMFYNQRTYDLRNQYQADIVTLFTVKQNNGFCGMGYIPRKVIAANYNYATYYWRLYASNAVAINCTNTLAHEIGHNLGLGHSPKQQNNIPYGFLYRDGTGHGVNNDFVTIMAYTNVYNTSNIENKFSSPNLTCGSGHPCGIQNISNAVPALNKIAFYASDLASNCSANYNGGQPTTYCRYTMVLPN